MSSNQRDHRSVAANCLMSTPHSMMQPSITTTVAAQLAECLMSESSQYPKPAAN